MKTMRSEKRKEMKKNNLNKAGFARDAVENRADIVKGPTDYTAQKLKNAIDKMTR